MKNKKAKTKLELELIREKREEREIQRVTAGPFAEKVIEELEDRRKERRKKYPAYTQKYVAEQAGISLSTYKEYVSGCSYCIDLITVKQIADILGCRLSEVIEKAER